MPYVGVQHSCLIGDQWGRDDTSMSVEGNMVAHFRYLKTMQNKIHRMNNKSDTVGSLT